MNKPRVKVSREVLEHIDPTKPVRVYRNLHKKCLSVKQGSLVRCHVDNVVLKDCKFIVSKAGQRRVRNEKKKNVHAFVEGFVVNAREADHVDSSVSDAALCEGKSNWQLLYYNPYECDGFESSVTGSEAKYADYVDLYADGYMGPEIYAAGVTFIVDNNE